MNSDRRCDGCVFYERHPVQLGFGMCRQGPPSPVLTGQGVLAVFPPVQAENWCFKWQAPIQVEGGLQGGAQGRVLAGD